MMNKVGTKRKIEAGRAAFAYEKVKHTIDDKSVSSKEYRSVINDVPMYIKNNGLGSTMAFVFSKKNKQPQWKALYLQLQEWAYSNCSHLLNDPDKKDLMEEIVHMESGSYRALTLEFLSLLNWMKRFTNGMVNK